ncbi:MAG: hypothetical protein LLG08_04960 [Actinomycetia bacterium]|nr:hypothetical protein [Actinomycetes bacterium]
MIILGILQNIALLVMLNALLQLIIRRWTTNSAARQILAGVLYGVITLIGMTTPFTIIPGIFFDGRSIILAVAGLFGGPLTALVAALIALAYRLYLGGGGIVMGTLVIVESAALGAIFHQLRKRGLPVMRPANLWGFGVLVHAIMLALTLTLPRESGPSVFSQIALPVLALYPIALVLVSRLMLDQEERLHDETELRKLNESLEAEVAGRTRALQTANERLAAESDAKTRFLRSMSHELRTPLNSIIGFSDILGKGMAGELNEEQERQVGMIGTAGKHLLALINDILDLSRIEAGAVKVEHQQIDIRPLVEAVAAALTPDAAAKELTIDVVFETSEFTITSDPRKVSQILLNLASNAVKYTERGSATVRVHRSGESVSFSVEDTGPGIPAAELEKVFAEFTRGERTIGQSDEGTGLGLAISRGLAELLGGRIDAQSEVGRGSIFTLVLPVSQ